VQQTDGKSLRPPVQQHLPQQEIQKTGLSVQAFNSSSNNMLKVTTAVQWIISELSEAVSDKGKILAIAKMVLNETKWLLEFIGHSES
jgi:hypothetical protein